MKIAVPAQDGNLDAKIDMRFGRAKCFIVVDLDTWEFDVAGADAPAFPQNSAGAES